VIFTDAPADNLGKGESFSPTDLLAASLASCIATTLAIYAMKKGWDLKGMKVEVEKEMEATPQRRIGRLPITLYLPQSMSKEEMLLVERVAKTCPVHKALAAEIEIPLTIKYLCIDSC
jgi:uncharacterized OsmC-like protein